MSLSPSLATTLGTLSRRPAVTRLHLDGLTEADVGLLITELTPDPPAGDVVSALHRRTAGNPFFVVELARLYVETRAFDAVPDGARRGPSQREPALRAEPRPAGRRRSPRPGVRHRRAGRRRRRRRGRDGARRPRRGAGGRCGAGDASVCSRRPPWNACGCSRGQRRHRHLTPTATLQVSGTFTVSNSAQVTSPSLYVNSSGNIGIGTSTPALRSQFSAAHPAAAHRRWLRPSWAGKRTSGRLGDRRRHRAVMLPQRHHTAYTTACRGLPSSTRGERRHRRTGGPIAKLDVARHHLRLRHRPGRQHHHHRLRQQRNGALRYTNVSDTLQICTGSGWKSLASAPRRRAPSPAPAAPRRWPTGPAPAASPTIPTASIGMPPTTGLGRRHQQPDRRP